jgi:predicted peptidase
MTGKTCRYTGPVVLGLLCLGAIALAHDGTPQTGFLDQIYQGPDGQESKYVVFVPHSYDGNKVFPVILFLHGAGQTGTDGRLQVRGALGEAIRKQEKTFPFVAVFPQSHEGSWQAGSRDGKRALAILDEVKKHFRVDLKRVYLTGISMGAEGTWSLAAAHPERWAAIVPICGGGDPGTAARFKQIPCWCFHGDADRVIEVRLSRTMIRALRDAGGRPLYHEYPGVDHNCWDQTYANPDLYEWLLLQTRNS